MRICSFAQLTLADTSPAQSFFVLFQLVKERQKYLDLTAENLNYNIFTTFINGFACDSNLKIILRGLELVSIGSIRS